MAYKFQLGHAIMSGALDQDGDILVKDEAGAVKISLEQDGDLSGSGDFEFGGSVKLLGTAIADANVGADVLFYMDADDGLMKRGSLSSYATSIAGDGLAASSGVLAVGVDDSSIETSGDALRVKAAGITDAMLNDDVATGLAGDGLAASSGVLAINVSGAIHTTSDKLGLTGSLAGDGLGYDGGVDSILSLKVNVDDSSIETSGDALRVKAAGITDAMLNDDVATGLAGDGLAASSGVLAVAVTGAVHITSDKVGLTGSLAGDGIGFLGGVDSISALSLDINELTAAAVDVSADSIAIVDANDGNASRKESIADLATAMAGTGVTATDGVFSVDVAGGDRVSVAAKANGATLAAGLNYHAAVQTGSVNYVLPAVASSENGDIVTVKGNSGTTETRFINIAPDTGDSIDGVANQNIKLESPSAAVQLIYVHADTSWRLV